MDDLICELQASTKHEEGFFVYLRQNPANKRNPYDLVPFRQQELGLDSRQTRTRSLAAGAGEQTGQPGAGGSAEESQSRASKNLNAIEDFRRTEARRVLEHPAGKKAAPQRASGPSQGEEVPQAPQFKYYTLSKKGMATFINNEPCEFIRIENWLAERAQFDQISQKRFFANFRTWKILRMWRLNILSARRELVTANLKAKLFHADPTFGRVLLQHRAGCKDLEKLRVLDLQQPSRDSFAAEDFRKQQELLRGRVEASVRDASDRTRDLFKSAITSILDDLRTRIHKQDEVDQSAETGPAPGRPEPALAANKASLGTANELRLMRQIEKLDKNQSPGQDPVYEQLGFKHNLKFSARNELRDACKKFLRFAFLLDFIALESLSNIFLHSIHDTTEQLR